MPNNPAVSINLPQAIFSWSILLQMHSHFLRFWSFSLQGASSARCSSIQFSSGLRSFHRVTEQPVLATHRERSDGIFAEVISEAAASVFQISHGCFPAVLQTGQRLVQTGVTGVCHDVFLHNCSCCSKIVQL